MLPFFIKQREWGGVGTGSVVESILTLICSSYLIERPLSQSKPNLIRCITKRFGKTLMHVRFTVVLLKKEEKRSTVSIYVPQTCSSFSIDV